MKNAKVKLMVATLGLVGLVGGLVAPLAFASDPMSTTTLGANIDTISGTFGDYIATMIAKYWPFLLGGLILLGVIGFGRRAILSAFHR